MRREKEHSWEVAFYKQGPQFTFSCKFFKERRCTYHSTELMGTDVCSSIVWLWKLRAGQPYLNDVQNKTFQGFRNMLLVSYLHVYSKIDFKIRSVISENVILISSER